MCVNVRACVCVSATSRSRTRRVRRHSTARRSRWTARPTASESTRTQTRPSSTRTARSLASTAAARKAASASTRTERRRQLCRRLYNARQTRPDIQPPAKPTLTATASTCSSAASATTTPSVMMMAVTDGCCLNCCFCVVQRRRRHPADMSTSQRTLLYSTAVQYRTDSTTYCTRQYCIVLCHVRCSCGLWQLNFQLLFGALRLVSCPLTEYK